MKEIENELPFTSPRDVFNFPAADAAALEYKTAKPFAHAIFDGFIKKEVSRLISGQLQSDDSRLPVTFNDDVQKNKMISTGNAVPRLISLLAAKFASAEVLRYLESVTGLRGLIPDPYYNTEYGYYHIVGPGGILGSHVDHSHHQSLKIPHVLNLVVYLTENWKKDDGGALCLFNEDGRQLVKKIDCQFNRAVLFAANPIAYHGVEPIDKGCGSKRRSIYFAYYSVTNCQEMVEAIPALYERGAMENNNISYGTHFVIPWSALFKKKNLPHLKMRSAAIFKLLVPPVVTLGATRIYKRFRSKSTKASQ